MKDTRRFYKVDGLLFQPLFFFFENAEQLVKMLSVKLKAPPSGILF